MTLLVTKDRANLGYTVVDLFFVLVTIGAWAALFLPVFTRTKNQSEAALCAANHRDLITAWTGYADENEALCNNFTIPDVEASITSATFANWANNIMTWSATSSTADRSVTNIDWARRSTLAPYASDPVRMCKCPSDKFLSPSQKQRLYKTRLRSVAMNALVGYVDFQTATGRSWVGGGTYRQFLKMSDIPDPEHTWVFLDEHPDYVNDGFFVVPYNATAWGNFPSTLHNGATTFSFSDGHVELRKWRSSTARIPVRLSNPAPSKPFDSLGQLDFEWYKQNTGYIHY